MTKMIPVDIVRVEEPWAKAYLPDGSVMKVKLIFDSCARVLDEQGKPTFNPDGTPCYHIRFAPHISCDAPESARKSEMVK
jgi:hypothetical protein